MVIEKTERNATITTGISTSTLVSDERYIGKRVILEISNTNAVGGADVFICANEEAAANKGRRCQPGQTIAWNIDSNYLPTQRRINAFSTAATILSVYEEIETRQ